MKTILVFVTAALLAGGSKDSEQVQKDKRDLQGTWKVISAVQRGELVSQDDIRDTEIVFSGTHIHVREGGKQSRKFQFKIDPGKKPKEIDLTVVEGPGKGNIDRAIYQQDGDNLKIRIQENKDEPRPKDFVEREGDKLSMVVLRRFK
ncbi:MAG: TIGR03067 domain-containing protein [Gemmataceae bacterium]|nr:TIGR03067 domain-containing protein [Gemmataceae bacterium]MCI0737790.1 TIGR03067 domain-containing protein [Gemmataceae bacterium]